MGPPGLQPGPYVHGKGAVPNALGARVGPRPPAAGFGADGAKRASEALELWNMLDNPAGNGPESPETLFSPSTVALKKKGERFVESLVRKGSFAVARQGQKIHERACRHRGVEVFPPERELMRAISRYKACRAGM